MNEVIIWTKQSEKESSWSNFYVSHMNPEMKINTKLEEER